MEIEQIEIPRLEQEIERRSNETKVYLPQQTYAETTVLHKGDDIVWQFGQYVFGVQVLAFGENIADRPSVVLDAGTKSVEIGSVHITPNEVREELHLRRLPPGTKVVAPFVQPSGQFYGLSNGNAPLFRGEIIARKDLHVRVRFADGTSCYVHGRYVMQDDDTYKINQYVSVYVSSLRGYELAQIAEMTKAGRVSSVILSNRKREAITEDKGFAQIVPPGYIRLHELFE